MFKFAALIALLPVVLATRSLTSRLAAATAVFNIHPNGVTTKCLGVNGGLYVVGSAIDVYDCNASATQAWSFTEGNIATINPATGELFCLDVPTTANQPPLLSNGLKTILTKCSQGEEGSPTQSWSQPPPQIKLGLSDSTGKIMCLDNTDGLTTNRNPAQLWECYLGNPNQNWTTSNV